MDTIDINTAKALAADVMAESIVTSGKQGEVIERKLAEIEAAEAG